jgi:uncharacterized repeat protein (TIGR01451 family)/LPXTG-motif cell wall-anchored protein
MLFRKLVSNLPFSPALLNQLGFYAKRVRTEQATRRIGLLFTVLALVVQYFAIFKPPEPALATNPNNIVFNGISSKSDLLNVWDRNNDGHGHKDVQQIFRYFLGQDFSRKDLENTSIGSFGSRDKVDGGQILSLGRTQQTTDPAQKAHTIRGVDGSTTTIWSRHLSAFDTGARQSGRGTIYQGFLGQHNGKWFAVMKECGNIAFSDTIKPPSITPIFTVKATCQEINGYAYDQTNPNASLRAYIYLNGGPGSGEQYTTTANLSSPSADVGGNHGFSLTVPDKYHTGKKYAYTVVIMPAYPENQSAQFSGTIDTASCVQATPVAQCLNLQSTPVANKQNTYTLTASSSVGGGAKITGYHYTVTDQNNKIVFDKTYNSTAINQTSEQFTLEQPGTYSSKVVVLTTTGEKTSADCVHPLTVSPPSQCALNPSLPANSSECKACAGDSTIWYKNPACTPQLVQYKTVKNLTQNIADANNTTVKPGDRLEYDLFVQNTGKLPITTDFTEQLADVLEYANLSNFGASSLPNSVYSSSSQTLTWKNITLAPGQKFTQSVIVAVKDPIPATPRSASNPESYDCKMGNVFGGSATTVNVQCPVQKTIESTSQSLPQTGTGTNILFGAGLLVVVTYFYMRSRQLSKEVKLLRKEYNYGTI